MKSFNKLSAAQIERLAILAEECGETVQAAMKVIRRGYDRKHPRKPGPTNRGHLEEEIGNILNAVEMLVEAGDGRPTGEVNGPVNSVPVQNSPSAG